MKQEMMGGSGNCWTIVMQIICTSLRQITMPAPLHSIFTGRVPSPRWPIMCLAGR